MNALVKILLLSLLLILLSSCASNPPRQPQNICEIFYEKKSWYRSAKKAEKRHGTPIHVQMAIMYQESSFKAKAKPPRKKILGLIPWKRPSSAFGYAQVKDETWAWYMQKNNKFFASRSNFGDAIDFVAWYVKVVNEKLGVSKWDTYQQYLAYHEGMGGFQNKSYLKKPWLVKVAQKVKQRSLTYAGQLKTCKRSLNRWWMF